MKKNIKVIWVLFVSLLLLFACSSQSQNSKGNSEGSSSASSSTTSSNSSSATESSESSSEVSSTETEGSASSTEVANIEPINTGAILKADYTTMIGSWQNSDGEFLYFSETGLSTEGLIADFLDIDQHGILLLDVQTGVKTNITLYIVPAGVAFPSDYLWDGQTDTSDTSRDRIISSADLALTDFSAKVYYHMSN